MDMKHWWNDDSSQWDYFHWYCDPQIHLLYQQPLTMDGHGATQEKTGMFREKLAPVLSLYSTGANVGLNSGLQGEIQEINA
jgi:hypothetical protein